MAQDVLQRMFHPGIVLYDLRLKVTSLGFKIRLYLLRMSEIQTHSCDIKNCGISSMKINPYFII